MINLITKDIVSQWKFLGFIFILFLVFSYAGDFGQVYLGVGLLMFAMRIAYLEDENNALFFLRTMPLKSATIVWSKYFSILVVSLVAILLGSGKLYLTQELNIETLASVLSGISVMLLFSGGFFILFFKMGYIKAATYFRVVLITTFLLFFAGTSFLGKVKPILEKLFIQFPLNGQTLLIVQALVIVLYLAMGLIATRVFEGQEIAS